MTWTPMYCFAAIATIFVISEYLSFKTKGYVSFLVFASIIFAAGYWTGVLPKELVQITGISGIMGALVMPMIVTNLGASININKMIREWHTVIISLMAVIGILVLCCTVGTAIFGRVYSYSAVGPIAGGLVAAALVQEAATKANAPEIAAFAMVLISVQNMIALPIASVCIKYDVRSKIASGKLEQASKEQAKSQIKSVKLFPDIPKHLDTSTMSFFKVAVVTALCVLIGTIVPIPATVSSLILGCILCTVNFLPEAPLRKAGG